MLAIYGSNAGSNKHIFHHERLTLIIPFIVGHIFYLQSIHSLLGQPMWSVHQYTSTMNLYEGPRMMEASSTAFFVDVRRAQSGPIAYGYFVGKIRLKELEGITELQTKKLYRHDYYHLLSLITTLISAYHQSGRYPVSK